MYCFITTVSVAFYWARSDETLHYKSDETVNFCCFRCATASPISVFYKLRLIHLYFLLLFFVGFDVSDFYKVTSTSLIFYLLAPKGCELVATKTMNPSTYREFALEFGNTSEFFVICIRYNTVWSELCECNEQTHSRQCCNLLISWRVNAGTLLRLSWWGRPQLIKVQLCQLAWNGCGKFCLVFFNILEEDEIEDCSHQTNEFLHPLRD